MTPHDDGLICRLLAADVKDDNDEIMHLLSLLAAQHYFLGNETTIMTNDDLCEGFIPREQVRLDY